MPEKESEPPQFSPRTMDDGGRLHAFFGGRALDEARHLAARRFDGGARSAARLERQPSQTGRRAW